MKITFFGGAGSVTGANYLLENNQEKVLIDCGLFQGERYCEEKNWEGFPYKPEEVGAVLITHAHIDHIGRLPLLFKAGFRGSIFSTAPTKDFAEFLLLDSEHILSEEARFSGKPILYNRDDVVRLMALWRKLPYHKPFSAAGFEAEFYDAGHILGSASILVSGKGRKIVFSGDLGNSPEPLIKETEYVKNADYGCVESVYGDRIHEETAERKDKLENIIEETARDGGTLLMPAFALERTQEILFELNDLFENRRIPRMPVFLDSPLAIKLTAVYEKYSLDPMYFNENSIALTRAGDEIFNFPGLQTAFTREQSKEIDNVPGPKIIIAGAGMSNGGRILRHEARYLSRPETTILMLGYQGSGSLGRQILDGEKQVKIFGEEVLVRARVESLGAYSAHADQTKLMMWVEELGADVKKLFVVQGDEESEKALVQKVRDELALDAVAPKYGQSFVLG